MRIIKPLRKTTHGELTKKSKLEFDLDNVQVDIVPSSEDLQQESGLKEAAANEEHRKLKDRGFRLLAIREHSTQELHQKLMSKNASSDLASLVVAELEHDGYVSNDRFTEAYIRSRQKKGVGPVKIKVELKSRGIEPDLIDEYLDSDAKEWTEIAMEQYHKKFFSSPVTDYKTWAKRAQYLVNRGFSQDQVRATIPEI